MMRIGKKRALETALALAVLCAIITLETNIAKPSNPSTSNQHMPEVLPSATASDESFYNLRGTKKIGPRSRRMKFPTLPDVRSFFAYLDRVDRSSCRKLVSFGGFSCYKNMDGNKDVCLDGQLFPSSGKLMILSFGVGNDLTFEDVVSFYNKDSEIHMFDPTVDPLDNLTSSQYFYQVGITVGFKKLFALSPNVVREMVPVSTVLEMVGWRGKTIDYLKMDIEFTEWEILADMASKRQLSYVNQLAIELHFSDFKYRPAHEWLQLLQERFEILEAIKRSGFALVSTHWNYHPNCWVTLPGENKKRSACAEVLFVRSYS